MNILDGFEEMVLTKTNVLFLLGPDLDSDKEMSIFGHISAPFLILTLDILCSAQYRLGKNHTHHYAYADPIRFLVQ